MKNETAKRFKRVRLLDIAHIFLFLIAFPIGKLYSLKRKNIWLLCEYRDEARDNAYWLFKYLREQQPHIDAVYAINKKSKDYKKVSTLGQTVSYGSFKHWVYYIAARANVSTQKGGKPNAAVCYVLEVRGIWKNTRVFLQHGVVLSELPYLFYKNAKLNLIMCGAYPEYLSIKSSYGYPEDSICYTGMCRFDRLHDAVRDKSKILIVPTWRDYIYSAASSSQEFEQTEYFKQWSALLSSSKLEQLLTQYDMNVLFCPHRNMQKLGASFKSSSPRIAVVSWDKIDISKEIESASVMITDYSSISVDFAYMKRPVLYYQFDREHFRSEHLKKSYFDFEDDGFGPVCEDADALTEKLLAVLENECCPQEQYLKRHERFFKLYDNKNCLRTYEQIADYVGKGNEDV